MTSTLIALLADRAAAHATRDAYTFLEDGEGDARVVSCGELDRRARALGAWLASRAKQGDRALIVMRPGLDYIAAFFGCLYAGLVAVPVPVPDRKRGLPRLRAIVRDCEPRLALVADEAGIPDRDETLSTVEWLPVDRMPDGTADAWRAPATSASDLAFLQYTSGSTGTPKGVALSHANLLANQRTIQRAFGHTADSVIVGWLPPHHDMGLIGNLLQPLFLGARCVQMAPHHFLMKPVRWLATISRHRGTTSGGPNFAYELCARRITEEQKHGLELSSWRVAFNGAEPVRAATLDRFADAFAGVGFRRSAFFPCYGLAEATLFVTGGELDAPPVVRVDRVGCGRPHGDDVVRIVDPERGVTCDDGEVGEIWVAGASVAQGYWRNPAESARTFEARLATGEGPFLRTGDLGRFDGGELFVTGRRKDLMIVRGRNVHPEDVELTVDESHPSLRAGAGAAFSVERDGEERVVIVREYDRAGAEPAEIARAIRTAVAASHEIAVGEVVLIRSGTLPRTTSGKVQRHACRTTYLDGRLHAVWSGPTSVTEPTTALETIVAEVWADVLGVRVGRDDAFLAVGGDSLRAAQVSARLCEVCGVEVTPGQLFESPTVASLAAWLETRARTSAEAPMTPTEGPVPLSPAQARLWLVDELASGAPVLHVAVTVRIARAIDVPALEQAVGMVVARHAALRTRFPTVDGRPVQDIVAPAPITLPVRELARGALDDEARRTFDRSATPPVRWTLWRGEDGDHLLALVCHHLIADGWTVQLVLGEVLAAYADLAAGRLPALPPVPQQYADVAHDAVDAADLAYWREHLRGAARLELPVDRPRSSGASFAGAREDASLGPELTRAIDALARREGVTRFAVLAAAFIAFCHRISGQRDICIGVPVAGRRRVALERVAGCFVETIALRVDASGWPTFATLVARTAAALAAAQAHPRAPFDQVVDALAVRRVAGQTPLFGVMLAMQPALPAGVERIDTGTAQFELTLDLAPAGDSIAGAFEYATDRFDRATVARWSEQLQRVLACALADPLARVSDLALVSPDEATTIATWERAEATGEPRAAHRRFFEQAACMPEAIAVVDDRPVTYRELAARARRIAGALRARGVGPEVRVGIQLPRSASLIAAVLGVLEAGAAYVPLDPRDPSARIEATIADARLRIVITDEDTLDDVGDIADADPAPEQAAYVIYTSGSTGAPKGVVVPHGALARFVETAIAHYGITPADRVLQFATIGFDASVEEIFPCLAAGATLVLRTDEMLASAATFAAACAAHRVTVLDLPTSFWHVLADVAASIPPCVRLVIVGGEAARTEAAAAWRRAAPAVRLINTYGPTETTVVATACDLGEVDGAPIGRPIAGARVHVLDGAMRPVPVGAIGELFIGGDGVARGYLDRPELTAARFVPDPFGPAGARLYRSGDRARWRSDGLLEFCGRVDRQLKLRGFRIEPGELEAHLVAAGAREAIVVVRDERLVAYVTGVTDPAVLRASLVAAFPTYMVPSLEVHDRLPRSPSGKIDASALPAPAERTPSVVLCGELEQTIAALWHEALGVSAVGVDENFFELGGHSLLLAQLAATLAERLGRDVPVLLLFRHPTIASLAAALRGDAAPTDDARDPDQTRAAHARRAELFARRRRQEVE